MKKSLTVNNKHLENQTRINIYKELFAGFPDGLFLLGKTGKFLECNDGLAITTGYSKNELLHSNFLDYVVFTEAHKVKQSLRKALYGDIQEVNIQIVQKSKEIRYVDAIFVPARINGELVGIYGIAKDITEKIKLEQALLNSNLRFESLIQNSSDVIAILDENGIIKYQSSAVKNIIGYEPSELIGKHVFETIYEEDVHYAQTFFKKSLKSKKSQKTEVRVTKSDGSFIYCEAYVTNLLHDETVNGIVVNYRDISERKAYEEEIYRMAYHDYLTKLPNRYRFETSLLEEIEKLDDTKGKIAILLIDLDRFKVINDSLGHHVGDLLLQQVALRLKDRVANNQMIFRLGGDEFVILLPGVDKEMAGFVSEEIIKTFKEPFHLHSIEVFTSPSIGITMLPDDGKTVEQIMSNADFAMYQTKRNGKNGYSFYSRQVSDTINPLKMEMELHRAIQRNELTLHYQPKINLRTGEVIGVEALVRWLHPEWGMISPATFIPLAEETGLIQTIGDWVIHTACKQNKQWSLMGFSTVVSVNLSVRQFTQLDLVNKVKQVLEETGLEPDLLELEITESMTANIEQTIITLHELKELGIKISIDDFGTGFSSLNYLKEFPVDTLKIDQSFVRNLSQASNNETIVKTIISMAHNLNLNVVAEGIETNEQLLFLQEHLCNEGQGYLFSKPVSASEIEEKYVNLNNLENLTNGTGQMTTVFNGREQIDQQEMAIRHNQELYSLIVKNSTDLISILDQNGYMVYVSPSHSQALGYDLDSFRKRSMINLIHPDDIPKITAAFEKAVHKREPGYIEFRYLHQKGHWVLLDCSLTPVTTTNLVRRLIVIGREKRMTEDLLRKDEKLDIAGKLAVGVAHELRNSMTSLKGFLQLFEQGENSNIYYKIMNSSLTNMEKFIDDLLLLTRPTLCHSVVNMKALIEQVASTILDKELLQDIQIILKANRDLPAIVCDQEQIELVIKNLLSNSIDAMPEGGSITVQLEVDNGSMLMKVTDTGIGMKEQRIKKLGEPYYSYEEKGFGLGLMICYRIILAHQGTIHIESQVNQGTIVEIRLPLYS